MLRFALVGLACAGLGFVVPSVAFAGGSAPKVEKKKADPAVEHYNRGCKELFAGRYEAAIPHFRKALKEKEAFPEAHNNLAFCLRRQGEESFQEALQHYDRAVALAPDLAEPRMYRGVLYVQLGRADDAAAELAVLKKLRSNLAAELQWVIDNKKEKTPDRFFGVFK
jgi:Flp pilus assembly protein TadD